MYVYKRMHLCENIWLDKTTLCGLVCLCMCAHAHMHEINDEIYNMFKIII